MKVVLIAHSTGVFYAEVGSSLNLLGEVLEGEEHGMSRELVDRVEIETLMKSYCLFFDTKRAKDLAALFTDDARIDYGPELEPVIGSQKLEEMVRAGMANRFESTNHQISNEIVTFTSESTAVGTSHLYAWHKYFDSEVIGHLYGGYRYHFIKKSAGWKISDLKLFASGTDGFHRETMHDFRQILDQ